MGPYEESVEEAEARLDRVQRDREAAAEAARRKEWDRWESYVGRARRDVTEARNREALNNFRGQLWERINGL